MVYSRYVYVDHWFVFVRAGSIAGWRSRRRPYRVECTGSLLTSEIKRHRARLVLGWGTAWEHPRVLSAFCVCLVVAHATMFSGAHACPTR
jgi:hypothetical protein